MEILREKISRTEPEAKVFNYCLLVSYKLLNTRLINTTLSDYVKKQTPTFLFKKNNIFRLSKLRTLVGGPILIPFH